eukprot:TRINITY_DN2295_c0_g1_i2.p1 TRINITY_DN2295_c0_g1~~TRINITY_DN2295_c0_g1_i2.p1  ORF type:complete len:201 (+),score=75.70 TRINITY_DN2295_c0_g1_i2:348-950(+)
MHVHLFLVFLPSSPPLIIHECMLFRLLPLCVCSDRADELAFLERQQRFFLSLDTYDEAPFTLQRLAELTRNPERTYKKPSKYLAALEKMVNISTTMIPLTPEEATSYNLTIPTSLVHSLSSSSSTSTTSSADPSSDESAPAPAPTLPSSSESSGMGGAIATVFPSSESSSPSSSTPETSTNETTNTTIEEAETPGDPMDM